MKLHRLFLMAVACAFASAAMAQYQWVDKDGRKVFSDRPPPMDVPQKNIVKEPRALTPARTAPAGVTGTQDGAAPAAKADNQGMAPATRPADASAAGSDKSLEEAKAKAEEQEKAKKKAEEDAKAKKEAQARADNCQRARQAKVTLEPGRLVASTNTKGERSYMDDATRAAELQRTDQIIQRDCK